VARETQSTTRKRRRFTAEFKAEAVRLVAGGGKPLAQIARELGINEQVLRHWKKQAQADNGNGVRPEHFAQDEENRRLRRELARVTEERDILKKATAFFATQSR
jgi:transposase